MSFASDFFPWADWYFTFGTVEICLKLSNYVKLEVIIGLTRLGFGKKKKARFGAKKIAPEPVILDGSSGCFEPAEIWPIFPNSRLLVRNSFPKNWSGLNVSRKIVSKTRPFSDWTGLNLITSS